MVSGLSTSPPAPHRILQVAYYEGLLRTRATMLQRAGYTVVSVLGSEARIIVPRVISASDLVLIGFSGPYADRASLVRWLKQEYPRLPLVALQARLSERFPEADCVTLSEDPEVWLGAVAGCLARK